jgi:nitrate/TMAO reductase-like tetraheme cytochrome c subunit
MILKAAKPMSSIVCMVKRYWFAFLAGLVFAIVCFLVINATAKPFSTPRFCSNCHEMALAYRTWELSAHYANEKGVVAECADCHLPPKDKFFTHLATKAYVGCIDIFKHFFIGGYDFATARQKVLDTMPNERCLKCHSNLLTKPGSSAARTAHLAMSDPTEELESRCVECHEQLHEREEKIFLPD